MAALTEDALHRHDLRYMYPHTYCPRVTIRSASSGQVVAWFSIGETPDTIMSFPGKFTVGDVTGDTSQTWVRRATDGDEKKDRISRTLRGGEILEFVQVEPVKSLVLPDGLVGMDDQILASFGQTELKGYASKEAYNHIVEDTPPLMNLDAVDSPESASSLGETSTPKIRITMVRLDSLSSLASEDWFPDASH